MRAVVTGGTGFVGGHLCEALRARGWEVAALVRPTADTTLLEAAGCTLVPGSLDDPSALAEHLPSADVLFHLAAITRAVGWEEFRRVNATGTRSVAQCAREAGFAGRFVLLSSLAAAGPAPPDRPRLESDPCRPVSLYGRSKRLGERELLRVLPRERTVILRPGAIYGPREHEIYQIVKQLSRTGLGVLAGPDPQLQLTHVDDVVSALLLAAEHEEAAGKAFHLNDPNDWSMSEVFELLGRALDRRVRVVRLPAAVGWLAGGVIDQASRLAGRSLAPFNGDKMREVAAGSWLADSSTLSRVTGWRATWSLPRGLRETVAWYRQNGWLPQ